MFFEYENRTEIINIIKKSGAEHFTNAMLSLLGDKMTKEELAEIQTKVNPYQLADHLNDTVFCTRQYEEKGLDETEIKEEPMKILSVKQVNELTGFSRAFIYKHQDKLGCTKIGGKVVFIESKLEEALNDYQKVQDQEGDSLGVRNPTGQREVQQGRIPHQERSPISRIAGRKEIADECERLGLNPTDN